MSGDASSKPALLGQRHVLVLIAHLGIALVYCMRVNLSVALVAMVNNTESETNVTSGECPVQLTNNTASKPPSRGRQYSWSRELQGYILSSFFWGYIILQVPAGTLAQRYGAKWMFGVGVLWTSVLTLLTPLVADVSVYLLIAMRFLEGVGESVTFPAILAMLGRWAPRQETSFLCSLIVVGSAVGTIVGLITSGPLCASTFLGGWPSVFYTNGAVGILWFVPWCFLVYDSPETHPRISVEEKHYIMNSISSDQQQANSRPIPWKRILSSSYVWTYVFATLVAAWIGYTLLTCLPQFLSDVLRFKISDNGIVASLPYFPFIICSNVCSWLCDKMVAKGWVSKTRAKKFFSLVSQWICGALLFGITFVSCSKIAVISLLVVAYTFYSALYAGFYSNPLDLSPEYAGLIFGFGNVFATAAGIVTPLVTDSITVDGTVREWNIIFYIASGMAASSGLIYLLFGSSERQNWHLEDVAVCDDSEIAPDANASLIVNTINSNVEDADALAF